MLPLLLLSASLSQQNFLTNMNAVASAKDPIKLQSYMTPSLRAQLPHVADFLGSGGSYGVGRFGWKAYSLVDPVSKASYVVLSTPLTCEDMGEQVFVTNGSQITG